jgi:hypothetical protein
MTCMVHFEVNSGLPVEGLTRRLRLRWEAVPATETLWFLEVPENEKIVPNGLRDDLLAFLDQRVDRPLLCFFKDAVHYSENLALKEFTGRFIPHG